MAAIIRLYLCAALAMSSSWALAAWRAGGCTQFDDGNKEEEDNDDVPSVDWLDVLSTALTMMFAEEFLFATRWLFEGWEFLQHFDAEPTTVKGKVAFAVLLSLVMFVFICFLDRAMDLMKSQKGQGKGVKTAALETTIDSFAFLAALAWEVAFGSNMSKVGAGKHKLRFELVLVSLVWVLAVQNWRTLILKKAMKLADMRREQHEADKAQAIQGYSNLE